MSGRGSEHPDFRGAGAKPGIEIWRIEAMAPVPWPAERYGQFHEGDSYIILKTNGREMSSTLDWDLHFWLGDGTTHDEKGVAAYKTVELDDSLGGTPVQHRETQEHESALFCSYFKKGIEYLPGGVDSGFSHVRRPPLPPPAQPYVAVTGAARRGAGGGGGVQDAAAPPEGLAPHPRQAGGARLRLAQLRRRVFARHRRHPLPGNRCDHAAASCYRPLRRRGSGCSGCSGCCSG